MNPTLASILNYLIRVAPGLILGAGMLYLARREARLRIVTYLALFVLLRDAMTPQGLWFFGTQGFFWIRLSSDPWFLVIFGLSCLGMSLAMYGLDRENRALIVWSRGKRLVGFLWGFLGAAVVVLPMMMLYSQVAIDLRGGKVPLSNLVPILCFALMGNLLEETLFRGYVYGLLAQRMSALKAAAASGFVFCFCHMFLAITVTGFGYPILAFTLWEGIIAGVVGSKAGVLPATLTHGGAIFLLSSGMI